MEWLITACGLITLVAIAGGSIPLMLRRTERVQHLMIAFAAGVFLSAVFLHLLPVVGQEAGAGLQDGGEEGLDDQAGELGGGHVVAEVVEDDLGDRDREVGQLAALGNEVHVGAHVLEDDLLDAELLAAAALLVAALGLAAVPFAVAPAHAEIYGLVVGIDRYKHLRSMAWWSASTGTSTCRCSPAR